MRALLHECLEVSSLGAGACGVENRSVAPRAAQVACTPSAFVWRYPVWRLLLLVIALVDGMAVELLAEVVTAPRTRLVVFARRESLVPTMSIAVLVYLLEHLGAGLLGVGLSPLVV